MTKRVVSLIASATEIVHALGRGSWQVGRSHECDYPPEVRALPSLTAPRFSVDLPSRQIDRTVKDILREALSVYRVDAEHLRDLKPDVIVTQTQCEVCAVSEKDVEAALCDWTGSRPQVVSLRPDRLDDVWNDIRAAGAALDADQAAANLVQALQARMQDVSAKAKAARERPRVACIEWIDPLMAAGNWMPELVELAGGTNLFGEAGRHSPTLDPDDLVKADPDVILVSPCGLNLERTERELRAVADKLWWKRLHAVRGGRVAIADGNQFFNRPGPRLVESLEILAEVLQPKVRFGYEGTAWRWWRPTGPDHR